MLKDKLKTGNNDLLSQANKISYMKSPKYLLFILVIALLPYDAVKLLPSIYKPLSVLPLCLLALFCMKDLVRLKPDKATKYFLLFYVISATISLVRAFVAKTSFEHFSDWFVTLTIGVVLFCVVNLFFLDYSKKQSNERYKIWFAKCIAYAYYFPVFITCLDALSIYGILPSGVSGIIHAIFGGKQHSRICGFTFEASWLASHLLFAAAAYLYLYKKKKSKLNLFIATICVALVLLAVSLNGYIVLVFAMVFYWICGLSSKKPLWYIIVPIVFVVLCIIAITVLSNIQSDSYFIARFKNLTLDYLLHSDISVFIRLINPLLGLQMGIEHLPFGIGGGNYSLYYASYIYNEFPWVLNIYGGNNEVAATIALGNANCKSLLPRIIGETGIISIFYFVMLWSCVKKVFKGNSDLILWLGVAFGCILQFDSLCYFPWILFLAFINNLKTNTRKV